MVMLVIAVGVLLLIGAGLALVLARSRGGQTVNFKPPAADAPRPAEVGAALRPASLPAKKQLLLREVHDSEIEAQIRTGAMLDAITLYREKTGAGLKEAKVAVEAWRDRLRAS